MVKHKEYCMCISMFMVGLKQIYTHKMLRSIIYSNTPP